MAAKRKEESYPLTVSFGAGKVRICKRSNGFFKLAWRELGSPRNTTKTTEEKALEFANQKARDLDSGSGDRWIARGDADALVALRQIAGEGEGAVRRLLEDVRGARGWLAGSTADLTAAARWYAENGPMMVERVTVAAAVTRFLAEYQAGSKETLRTFSQELEGMEKKHPGAMLLDLDEPRLTAWARRRIHGGKAAASERTVDNRMTTWRTFLNRCRDWGLLQGGKHAGDLLRRPTLPDAGKAIFTVDQGRALLAAVRAHDADPARENPRLEVYFLIAGWLGLRLRRCSGSLGRRLIGSAGIVM